MQDRRVWTKSTPFKHSPIGIFPKNPRRYFLGPSCDKDEARIGLLLGWEYGNQWLRNRNEFLSKLSKSTEETFIKPDFNWWLKNRKSTKETFIKPDFKWWLKNRHLGQNHWQRNITIHISSHHKNMCLSAFDEARKRRQLAMQRKSEFNFFLRSIPETYELLRR
ncbi:uncharacterized protein LOC6651605 [Drosophila willistoni]|uniref:uncharacterized protein LOC6651605 n=1 Tax=Drosophila willistoni TaxID=7260 RepID=UPI00017D94AE|nr:uncharacterized protein LOC6651605 [Drosophila willistoni]